MNHDNGRSRCLNRGKIKGFPVANVSLTETLGTVAWGLAHTLEGGPNRSEAIALGPQTRELFVGFGSASPSERYLGTLRRCQRADSSQASGASGCLDSQIHYASIVGLGEI